MAGRGNIADTVRMVLGAFALLVIGAGPARGPGTVRARSRQSLRRLLVKAIMGEQGTITVQGSVVVTARDKAGNAAVEKRTVTLKR